MVNISPAAEVHHGAIQLKAVGPESLKHQLQVFSKIGNGAFGTVYKGIFDGRTVAVKTLSPDGMIDPDAQSLFFKEAQMLQECSHKNIVEFVAVCKMKAGRHGSKSSKKERWALVEEFLEGGTISRIVCDQMANPRATRYTKPQALQWCLDLALALQYLHTQSPPIIHRDVKSSNLLLSQQGGRITAKLADFGLHAVADASKECLLRAHSMSSVALRYDSVFFRPGSASEEQQEEPVISSALPPPGSAFDSTRLPFLSLPLPKQLGSSRLGSGTTATGSTEHLNRIGSSPGNCRVNDSQPASFSGARHGDMSAHASRLASDDVCIVMPDNVDSSQCSFATEATMIGGASCVFDEEMHQPALSDSELQEVYMFTGKTGSAMYMAPEVFKGEPYNEKVDVFSFAVVMYELLAKGMLVFSELPTTTVDPKAPDCYAAKVADGYRPRKPSGMDGDAWRLISDAWQQDPLERPCMDEVVQRLQQLLEKEQQQAKAKAGKDVATGQAAGASVGCSSCKLM